MAHFTLYNGESQIDTFEALAKSIGFSQKRSLYGINLDIRPEGCRIILKTYTDGKAEICFINASTFDRCSEVLTAFLESNADTGVKWRTDMYYKPFNS